MSGAPLVLAHAGHWLVSLAYIAPLIFLVGVIIAGKIRDRRAGPGDRAGVTQNSSKGHCLEVSGNRLGASCE